MRTSLRFGLGLALLLAWTSPAFAAEQKSDPTSNPALEAARTLSTVTGVAISPLLGVSAVGAYEYFQTPSERRDKLRWYARPYFWLPALLLVGLIATKDVLGTAAPTALKKPFDIAETVENKVSGMVAAGTFVPFAVTIFPSTADQTALALQQAGFAAVSGGDILNWLMVPFAIALFLIVWVSAHAINILIVLSPFTTVDALLKSFRASVLGMLTLTAWINPWVGALFSLVVVVFAWFIAGWAFRLLIVGSVFSWDFFTGRRHRFLPTANLNWMFIARAVGEVPIRTYGRLNTDATGKRTFEYRPWLVLPKRSLELPPGDYAIGRGFFFPEIMIVEAEHTKTMFSLPPRFNGHEADLARATSITDIRDVGLLKGLKAISSGFRFLFGMDPKPDTA